MFLKQYNSKRKKKMKCYTVKGMELFNGLELSSDEKRGKYVLLGEEGRGRHYERVALHKSNPPLENEGKINDAHPVLITLAETPEKAKREFYILAKPNKDDQRALVRVCTHGAYTKGTSGEYILKFRGNEKRILVTAYGAYGDAGRVGTYDDDLLVMHPGDEVHVQPSGGYKVSMMVLKLLETGEMVYEKKQDYEAAKASDQEGVFI